MSKSEPKTTPDQKSKSPKPTPGEPEQSALIKQIISELDRATTVLSSRLADLELPQGSGYPNPEDGIMRWCFSFETGDPLEPPLYKTAGSTVLPDLMCPEQVAQAGRVVASAITLLVMTPLLGRVEKAVRTHITALENEINVEPDYPILMGPDPDKFVQDTTTDPDDHV